MQLFKIKSFIKNKVGSVKLFAGFNLFIRNYSPKLRNFKRHWDGQNFWCGRQHSFTHLYYHCYYSDNHLAFGQSLRTFWLNRRYRRAQSLRICLNHRRQKINEGV